jgi:hypothetical protein
MNRSYVGIVTAQGLQAIYRESDHLVRFLHRRLYRKRPFTGFCYWAVMPDDRVGQIELQINQGDGQAALKSLQECADYLGPILPSSDTLSTFETH